MFRETLLVATLSTVIVTAPAMAVGIATVEGNDGQVDTYNVRISHEADTLYLQPRNNDTVVVIEKKDCKLEKGIQVCNNGTLVLNTQGVEESVDVDRFAIFLNTGTSKQLIEGSRVALSPNTVLIEVLTKKGTFITVLGKIDSTKSPIADTAATVPTAGSQKSP